MPSIAIIILLIVLIAIALRRVITVIVPIWTIMLIGAIATLLFKQITFSNALTAIEPEVIFYLFGVFLISQAAETSGYLEHLTNRLFFNARTGTQALLTIVFVLGLSAALLMNDTIAIIGTPIILQLCKSNKRLIKPLFFALAFSITIGSTASPIGNPQNLLIAVKGAMTSPFLDFFKILAIPALINLTIIYLFIYIIYRDILNKPIEKPTPKAINNHRTVTLVKISLITMFVLLATKIFTEYSAHSFHLDLGYIALISALPVLLSNQRWTFLKQLDWGTLIFFASTFILMQSVWDSGFFQASINNFHIPVTHIIVIILASVILSQFTSNVPLVALYLPLLIQHHLPDSHLLALAVGSTIAGNLSILGAASNVIIIQNIEKRKEEPFGFFEFIKLGLPLTMINILIYAYFL
jgi:Na+/H+ antiporter NhaD/arsenite permease-like protein